MPRETEGYRETLEMLREAYPEKAVLTIKEVAECLNCDKRTVTSLINKGVLPGINVGVGKYKVYRVSIRTLAKFLGGRGK